MDVWFLNGGDERGDNGEKNDGLKIGFDGEIRELELVKV